MRWCGLALQPEAGPLWCWLLGSRQLAVSRLVRPGTYSLAGYHHAIMQLVACEAVFAIARALGARRGRALGVPRALGDPRAPLVAWTLHIVRQPVATALSAALGHMGAPRALGGPSGSGRPLRLRTCTYMCDSGG